MPPKPGPDGRYKPGDEPPARPGFKDIQSKRTAGTAERFHGRLSLRDDAAAEAIFRRIRPLLPDTLYGKKPVACNPNLRLYRYSEGQRFGRHVDGAEILPRGRTEFTVLLYLSGREEAARRRSSGTTKSQTCSSRSSRPTARCCCTRTASVPDARGRAGHGRREVPVAARRAGVGVPVVRG